ncbi:MAG: helix-turn-helix transcriptional regulator [Clostridia bacterium]|nr:helix-turn-helix transcriptional regulator [Clostridia bacterium]
MIGKNLTKNGQPSGAVKIAMDYIRKNFRRDIKLDEISENVRYNKFYLCRVFKETTGQTIQNFILDLRINNAKVLLTKTNMPLTEIVYGSGFSSQAYFCHIFKRKMGMTPLQFRNFSNER